MGSSAPGDFMASKKRTAKAKARPRKTTKKASKATRKPLKKAARRAPKRAASPLASRMAKFSQQVVTEEEAPVAVRTFNEARAGIEVSKELDVKTGALQPKVDPLLGPLSLPKPRMEEELRLATPLKRGKKPNVPTNDDLGKIELKQQRGSGDMRVGSASSDYLQRSRQRALQSGRLVDSKVDHEKPKRAEEAFDVQRATGRGARPLAGEAPRGSVDASLLDFGEIEVSQQTRKGAKKVGNLQGEEEP